MDMKLSKKELEEMTLGEVTIRFYDLDALVTYFRNTAKSDAEMHKEAAEVILETLGRIANDSPEECDSMWRLYKDDIFDAITVYRESKGKA